MLTRITVNAAYGRLRARRALAEVSLDPFLPVFDGEGRHVRPVADWSGQLDNPAVVGEARATIERGLSRLPKSIEASS